MSPRSIAHGVRTVAIRMAVFAALFWILAEGRPAALPLAACIVVAAAMTSLALLRPGTLRFHPGGLLRFVPWFLSEAVRGGIDVAGRAVRPGMPLEPGFLEHRIELPVGPARVFLTNTVSLLPGTLSVSLRGDTLRIHALDIGQPLARRLQRVEQRVAELFGGQ